MGRRRVRWPAGLAGDPRGVRAGLWGGVVYRAALEMSEIQAWDGRLPGDAVRPGIFARHLNVPEAERAAIEPWLAQGIEDAFQEGLLASDGDGVVVAEWEAFAGRAGNRKRQADLRERRRRERAEAGGDVTLPTAGACHVTPPLPPGAAVRHVTYRYRVTRGRQRPPWKGETRLGGPRTAAAPSTPGRPIPTSRR